ncbi:PcfJ domain-containing protein [Burkholderia multivorans]|uniref:PcfJ domain-containing protein n=1 Tax=Burkholderia multivorans TaxID=87883 RepID=UPI001C234679|nr:PcfJ domain-containing protein [Burkholderia multivorans]MBU9199844.1 PcfJ domain-containing protein [Burkholderia multivorans]MDN8079037.1 PcfJ domain-containing protein [Burkholderia multivorans]
MKNADFDVSLLTALQSTQENRDDRKLFVKAAMALRAWYRHEALKEKPELIVRNSRDAFVVYGGARVIRTEQGLQLLNSADREQTPYVELVTIGRFLAGEARRSILLEYYERVKRLCRDHPIDEKVLQDVHEYTSYQLNINWWRTRCTMADDSRVLGRLLWDSGMLSREVFGLARRVYGFRFSAKQYNNCFVHREELAKRIAEAPHMAPWLAGRHGVLGVNETVWLDLKAEFISYFGGSAQGWRWLCGQGYAWFQGVGMTQANVQCLSRLAELQLGKIPYHGGLVSMLERQFFNGTKPDSRYFDVFKAAVVAHRKRKLKVSEFADYRLITDWLNNVSSANTKGATWASLMRKQRVWHMEYARQEAERRRESGVCYGWVPYVQQIQMGELEAVSLNTSDDLWEEGAVMVHCVGTYDEPCFRNQSRIYSIRRNGERVATLEIRQTSRKLAIGQLYGPGNSHVKDKDVNLLAKRVLAACNKAELPSPSENKVLRKPKKVPKTTPVPAEGPAAQAYAEEYGAQDIPF